MFANCLIFSFFFLWFVWNLLILMCVLIWCCNNRKKSDVQSNLRFANVWRKPDRWIIERARKEQNAPGRDGSNSPWHSEHVKSRQHIHLQYIYRRMGERKTRSFSDRNWLLSTKKTRKNNQSIPIIAIKFLKIKSFLQCIQRFFESWRRGIPKTSLHFILHCLWIVFFTTFQEILLRKMKVFCTFNTFYLLLNKPKSKKC